MIRAIRGTDLYERVEPRLQRRIGRELRLAGRVLQLGYASRDLAQYLERAHQQHVTVVDICPGISPLEPRLSGRPWNRCDRVLASHLDFVASQSMDAVVIVWALREAPHARRILREAYCALRPGGEVLVVEPAGEAHKGRVGHGGSDRLDELQGALDLAGFEEISAELIEHGQIIWVKGFRRQWL